MNRFWSKLPVLTDKPFWCNDVIDKGSRRRCQLHLPKCRNTPLSLQPAMDNEISPLQSQGIVNYGPCNCNSIIYYHPCNCKGNVNYGPCNCKPLSIRLPWQLQGYCQLVLQDLLSKSRSKNTNWWSNRNTWPRVAVSSVLTNQQTRSEVNTWPQVAVRGVST